jgi:hypothetical protein
MFGLIVAVVYFACNFVFTTATPFARYMEASHFLFWWYVMFYGLAFGCALGIVAMVALGVGITGASTRRLDEFGGFLGGMVVGGSLSLLAFSSTLLNATLYVGGAWLLMHAADGARDIGHLNVLKLVVGGLMILLGILRTRSRSDRSGSSSS